MLNLNLTLPKIKTTGFNFTSEARALPHGRSRRDQSRLSRLEWMLKYRRELAPDRPFDLTNHKFLRGLYEETARDIVVKKSSQAGVSEWCISDALYCCDILTATVLYVFPTDTHVSDFSAERLGLAIESSDYLSSIVVNGRMVGDTVVRKRGADKVTQKRVRDAFMYFRGGQVKPTGNAPQLKSIAVDALFIDEWDEVDARAPVIARKRLGHSKLALERAVSTPTYIGRGIDAEYDVTDQRQWHIRCMHCGHWQSLTIDNVVIEWDKLERPVSWHGQNEGRAFCACEKCKKELDRLADGIWVAKFPGRERVGYHISKLFTPLYDPLNAIKSLKSTNETERRECNNQDLGRGHKPRGGGLDDATLDACLRDYAFNEHRGTYMGIDVGALLHVVVRGRPNAESGERPLVFADEVTWDALPSIWKRYRPVMTVIDGGPEGAKARDFQKLAKSRIWLAFYQDDTDWEDFIRKDDEKLHIDLDRTRSLDAMVERFMEQINTLPANGKDLPNYYDQLKAPVRVLEKTSRGIDVARYVESRPDHFFHAENYCLAASKITKPGVPLAQGTVKGW